MDYKNIEIVSGGGLKCDNPKCDWVEENVPIEDYEKWLNAPCPKCGENVLTDDEYMNVKALMATVNLINSISPEELQQLTEGFTLEDFIGSNFIKDADGIDELTSDDTFVFSLDTHKEVKVTSIKKVEDEQ